MKKVYVNEERCLGCHLCEYYCAFANSGEAEFYKAFRLGRNAVPRIKVEDGNGINFAVQCRHCDDPLCMKNCIAGAISKVDGVVKIDHEKCVGCYTCVLSCPYGCVVADGGHSASKCELCTANGGIPQCVKGCINGAIVFEERGETA
ncbi:MAG: 4Fe-4S binding protein [Ruminiclostridium sp.]|nr:4Fe-4S binding protein [Ruminiclostridium sp.]